METLTSRVKSLIGEKFDRLTVISYAGTDSSRAALWDCVCSCDNKTIRVTGISLRAGRTKSCGCLQRDITSQKHETERRSMIGLKFGKLTVIDLDGIVNKQGYLKCVCECGMQTSVAARSLRSGGTKSCGCYNLERSSISNKERFDEHRLSMIGKRFGRLIVSEAAEVVDRCSRYVCICECGNSVTVRGSSLIAGFTKSCGCLAMETLIDRSTDHGLVNHPLYNTWNNMIQRCKNPNNNSYHNYGGRGIDVCEEWVTSPVPFIEWAENNNYQPGLTVDRKDNDGNYEPDNCRWATVTEQNRNKRNNVISDIQVVESIRKDSRSIKDISEDTGIPQQTIRDVKKQ